MLRFVLAFLLFGVLSSPTVLVAQTLPAPSFALKPGDKLRITVWRAPELSGEFSVAGDSSLSHPLYRAVKVAGVPLSEVDRRLRVFLTKYQADPEFSLELLFPVLVVGEVSAPSVYTFGPEISISRAVTLAGGPTKYARLDAVRLIREGQTYSVDLTEPAGLASASIQSGDQIRVLRKRDVFRDVIGPATTLMGAATSIITFTLFLSGQF